MQTIRVLETDPARMERSPCASAGEPEVAYEVVLVLQPQSADNAARARLAAGILRPGRLDRR